MSLLCSKLFSGSPSQSKSSLKSFFNGLQGHPAATSETHSSPFPRCSLSSSHASHLAIPWTCQAHTSPRAFAVFSAGNSPLPDIHMTHSLPPFTSLQNYPTSSLPFPAHPGDTATPPPPHSPLRLLCFILFHSAYLSPSYYILTCFLWPMSPAPRA